MVCKIGFPNWKTKIALLRASMVSTNYIKLFRTGADRHNGILMSILLLVVETNTVWYRSGVFIFDFNHSQHVNIVILLLTLNKHLSVV